MSCLSVTVIRICAVLLNLELQSVDQPPKRKKTYVPSRIIINPDCLKCLCCKFYILGGSGGWQNSGGEPH